MFRSLLNRAKQAWQRVTDWFRRKFAHQPLPPVQPVQRAQETNTHIASAPPQPPQPHSPIDEPLIAEPPLAFAEAIAEPSQAPVVPIALQPPRWLEGNARSADGRMVPWVLVPPERRYRLYIPASEAGEKDRAMVMMIHGCRQDAATFAAATRMNALADQHGFAVLYPDQSDVANLRRCWNWFESQTLLGKGEAAILLNMIDRAVKRANVDPERVAVAGLSSGGALAALLAYAHPERFSSVMVHSGLAPHAANSLASAMSAMSDGAALDIDALTDQYWRQQQLPPPSLFIVHGDADDRVHPANADALLDLWAGLNQAETPDLLMRIERDVAAALAHRAHRITQLNARDQMLAESVRVSGLAHAWSGGDTAHEFTDGLGPDVSRMFVEFARLDQRAALERMR